MPNKFKQIKLRWDSILGGHAPSWYMARDDQFLDSIGIDPEGVFSDNSSTEKRRYIGSIYPMGSTTRISGIYDLPVWISSAATTTGVFVYGAGGTLYSLKEGATLELCDDRDFIKPTDGDGSGLVVYGDYLYLATKTDIVRFGPLSTTQPTTVDYWGNSLHLGQAHLTDNTTNFPVTGSIVCPQHVMHLHNDGYVYVADYANGNGYIHSFSVSSAGATTAIYGDLTLPPGLYPMDIKSYGTDLAILCSPARVSGASNISNKSALILWDAISSNFYRNIPIAESLATSIMSNNGELFVLSGNPTLGVKLSKYIGGYSFKGLASFQDGTPPPAGASDSYGDMIAWGVYGSVPTTYAGVMTWGYRQSSLNNSARNCIMRLNTSATRVGALKFLRDFHHYPTVGWGTSGYGIDQSSASSCNSVIRKNFVIGKPFTIRRITLPLTTPVAAAHTVYPKIYVDGENSSYELPTINSTNFPNSEITIDFPNLAISGKHSFYIKLVWDGLQLGIAPGTTFEVDVYD